MSTQAIRKRRTTQKITYFFPVLTVSRSNKNIMVQVISPETQQVVFTVSSNKLDKATKTAKSTQIGQTVAQWLKDNNMPQAVFNRNGNLYHGRIQAVADAVREAGIII